MDLIGYLVQWNYLIRLVQEQKIPQVMIFLGQKKIGKKKIALEFVKVLNCQGIQWKSREKIVPCNSCLICQKIEKNRYQNLIYLEPEKGKKEISINQIRDLQNLLILKTQVGYFKTVIIDQAETLNSEAQNCLLKTLEEPPSQTILILITSQLEKLFLTIRSRCQILKFFPIPLSEILEELKKQKKEISELELKKIYFLTQGKIGEIIEFLEKPEKFPQILKFFQELEKLLKSKLYEKFVFIPKFFGSEISLEQLNSFLDNLENYLRIIFLKKTGLKNEFLDFFNFKELKNYSDSKLIEIFEDIQTLKKLASQANINLRLGLENLLLKL